MSNKQNIKSEEEDIQDLINTGRMLRAARIKGGQNRVKNFFGNRTREEISNYMRWVVSKRWEKERAKNQ
jgi:hypothetical protein